MQSQALSQVPAIQTVLQNENLSTQRRLALQRQLAWALQPTTGAGWLINHSYGAAVAEAVLFPWRSSSWGTVTSAGVAQPYVAPRDLHAALQATGRPNTGSDDTAFTLIGFAVGMWIAITMPLAFVLLPISRRRAKVRWGHLARVACYGLVVPSVIVACMFGCVAVGYAVTGAQTGSSWVAHVLGRFGLVLGVIVWWAAAIRCYLQIPHGWAVASILSILVFLVLVAILFVTGNLPLQ